jgi:hypothetical protein
VRAFRHKPYHNQETKKEIKINVMVKIEFTVTNDSETLRKDGTENLKITNMEIKKGNISYGMNSR